MSNLQRLYHGHSFIGTKDMGDIALLMGCHFDDSFLRLVIPVMEEDVTICKNMDKKRNMNHLADGTLKAYTGILQGLKNSKPHPMFGRVAPLVELLDLVFSETSVMQSPRQS